MKTFSKHFKALVALLLAVIMLLGSTLPALANAALASESGSGSASPGTSGSTSATGTAGGSVTEIDTGWFVLETTDKDIIVTLHPEKEALLNIGTEQLKAILGELIESFKNVVIEQIKDEMMGSVSGDANDWNGATADSIWTTALNKYIENNYSSADEITGYIEFFKAIVNDTKEVEALATYICDAIWIAYWGKVLDVEDLPEAKGEQLKDTLKNKFDTLFEDYIEKYKPKVKDLVVASIKEYIENNGSLPDDADVVDQFVSDNLPVYFETLIENYIDHKLNGGIDGTSVESYIDDYINNYIKTFISDLNVETIINTCLDKYLENIKGHMTDLANNPLPKYPLDGGEQSEEDLVKNFVTQKLHEYFQDNLDDVVYSLVKNYVTERTKGEQELNALISLEVYGTIHSIVNSIMVSDEFKSFARPKIDAKIDDFVRDEVTDRLSQNEGWAILTPDQQNSLITEAIENYKNDSANKETIDDFVETELKDLTGTEFGTYYEEYMAYLGYSAANDPDESGRAAYFLAQAFEKAPSDFNFAELISYEDRELALEKAKEVVDALGSDSEIFPELINKIFTEIKNDQTRFDELLSDALNYVFEQLNDNDITSIINSYLTDDVVNSAIFDVLGVEDQDALDTKVVEIINTVVEKYGDTLEEIKNNPNELDLNKLLSAFESLSVDDLRTDTNGPLVIFDGSLYLENIKTLLREIPTPLEIEKMDPEDMFVSYAFDLKTSFGAASFTVTVKMATDCPDCSAAVYDKFKTAVRIFNDHVKIGVNGSQFSLDIDVPEIFSDALLKAINTNKIPDSLKDKVYSLIYGDANDLYAFYADMTFDEIITLLEHINFEGVIAKLDNERLDNLFFKYTGVHLDSLTSEQIIAKVSEFEGRFNSLKDRLTVYINKVYDRVPEEYKNKTIFELGLYDGASNGAAEFSFARDFTITQDMLDKVQLALMEKFPEHQSKIIYIFGLVDVAGRSFGVDLNVSIPDLARVTYKIGDTVVKEGFLPEGADPTEYVKNKITVFEGRPIVGWYYEDGSECTSMPAKDIVLTAKLADVDILVYADPAFAYDNGVYTLSYDKNTYNIKVSVDSKYLTENAVSVSYEWLKDGVAYANGDTVSVTGRAEAGTYKVIATLTYAGNAGLTQSFENTFDVKVELPVYDNFVLSQPAVSDPSVQERELTATLAGDLEFIAPITYKWFYWTHDGEETETDLIVSGAPNSNNYTAVGKDASGSYRCYAVYTLDGEEFTVKSNVVDVSITFVPLDFTFNVAVTTVEDEPLSRVLKVTDFAVSNFSIYDVTYQWYFGENENNVNTAISGATSDEYKVVGTDNSGYYRCEMTVKVSEEQQLTKSVTTEKIDIAAVTDSDFTLVLTPGYNQKIDCTLTAVLCGTDVYSSHIDSINYNWYYKAEGEAERLISSSADTTSWLVDGYKNNGDYRVEAVITFKDGQEAKVAVQSNTVTVNIEELTADDFGFDITLSDQAPWNITSEISGDYTNYIDESTLVYEWSYRKNSSSEWQSMTVNSDKIENLTFRENGDYRLKVGFEALGGQAIDLSDELTVSIDFPEFDFVVDIEKAPVGDLAYVIDASVSSESYNKDEYTVTYKWYKDGELLEGDGITETTSSIEVFGVNSSGNYKVEATVTVSGYGLSDKSDSFESEAENVNIEKIVITPDKLWDYSVFNVSDPKYIILTGTYGEYSVIKSNISYPVAFEDEKSSSVGAHITKATLTDTDNYKFENDESELTLEWYIVGMLNVDGTPDPWVGPYEYTYDGSAHELKVIVHESFKDANIKYTWYKVTPDGNVLISGANSDTISLTNASESGVYKCVVKTETYGYIQTRAVEFDITINPVVVDFGDLVWTAPENFTYDGTEHTVDVLEIPEEYKDIIIADYDELTEGIQNNIVLKKPGQYTVKVILTVLGNGNYVLTEGEIPVYEVTVSKAQFDASKIHWNYTNPFKFTEGTEHTVAIVGFESFTFGDIEVLYDSESVNKASAVGTYTAIFSGFGMKDGDSFGDYYEVVGSLDIKSLEWEIEKELPPIIVPDKDFVYDEGDSYVKVTDSKGNLVGYAMKVSKSDTHDYVTIDGVKYKIVEAYDIVFEDDKGNSPTYGSADKYEVVFKIPESVKDEQLYIILIDEDGEEHELLLSEISSADGEITFDAAHFSIYAIAVEHTEPAPGPGEDEPGTPEEPGFKIDPLILVIIAVVLILLILILLIAVIKKGRKRAKFKRRLIVNEYDETAELYEDLAKYEFTARNTVYIDGERPADAFIEDSAPETYGTVNYYNSVGSETKIPVSADGNTEPEVVKIPTSKPAKPAPIIITPEYVASSSGKVPVTFTDSEGNVQTHTLQTAPLVIPVEGEKKGEIVMAPVVATVDGSVFRGDIEETKTPVKEEVPAEEPVAAVDSGYTINVTQTEVKPTKKAEPVLIPEAPIVAKRGETVRTGTEAPIVIKLPAVKHYEISATEAPVVRTVKENTEIEETPVVVQETVEPLKTEVIAETELINITFSEPVQPSYNMSELVFEEKSSAKKQSARVFFTVDKAETDKTEETVVLVDSSDAIVNVTFTDTDEVTEEVIEEVTEEVIEEVTEEVIEEVTEEVIEEVTEEVIEEVTEEVIEEVTEEVIEEVTEEVIEEVTEEIIEESAPEVTEEADEDDEDEDEEEEEIISEFSGQVVNIRYRKSFTSKLVQASDTVKEYYSMLKNAFMSFKGVKARTSWGCETFNKGRVTLAKVLIKGKTLVVCLNLDPKEYEDSKYHFKDVSDKAKYSKVPMLVKVRSSRGIRYAVDLVGEMMEKLDIKLGTLSNEDFRPEFISTEELIEKNLIKLILPQGVSMDENSTVVAINNDVEKTEISDTEESSVPAVEETENDTDN